MVARAARPATQVRSNQHDPGYFFRIIDRIDKRQRAAPGMTDNNRALDMELLERVVEQTRLNFDGHVNMLRPLAATVARTIKRHRLITRSQRRVESRPILTRAWISMDENDGLARALDDEVKIRAVNLDEL